MNRPLRGVWALEQAALRDASFLFRLGFERRGPGGSYQVGGLRLGRGPGCNSAAQTGCRSYAAGKFGCCMGDLTHLKSLARAKDANRDAGNNLRPLQG